MRQFVLTEEKRVLEQAAHLKERFKSERPVTPDTVVLELIAIKKTTIRSLNAKDWDDKTGRWPFALPRDVYRQIQISDDTIKDEYLIEIMVEYENIFKEDPYRWNRPGAIELSDKHVNRSRMKDWYTEIFLELQHYKSLLRNGKRNRKTKNSVQ